MLTKVLTTAVVALGLAGFAASPASARAGFHGGRGFHGGGFHGGGFHGGGFHGGWGRGYHRGWGGGGYGWGLGALGLGLGLAAAPYAYGGYPYGYGYGGGYYGGGCVLQRQPVWNGYRYVSGLVRVCY